ncbi:MAG: HDOD domain-containing protein [Betaproteobacteria bacterium]|nr:HDOD domain-containing protein [Betaproteobacteria bacterium]
MTAIETETLDETATIARESERAARELGIPPCPAILAGFSAEIRSADPDLRVLATLIGTDVALSAALLKTVNSSFYALECKATNVKQAMSILGLRACANLVTGLLLKKAFPSGSNREMRRFWDASSGLAAAAAGIAVRLEGINPDEAHTYALFRDCGMALMIRRFPIYTELIEQNSEMPGAQLIMLENSRFRYNHARVGYSLACDWLLPESMCKAILWHHQPESIAASFRDLEPANPKLVAFGLLAEQLIALRSGRGLCPDWRDAEEFVLGTLEISPEDVVALAEDFELAPSA